MTLTPAQLLSDLAKFPKAERYWIAFSGGLDSSVLLHAMAASRQALQADVAAVHIDHGLQTQSLVWQTHCEKFCHELNIPLTTLMVDVDRQSGKGLEAAARAARYQAFASILREGDAICLAQHQNDQAETLMLQLLRGSGVAGLAAMPRSKPFASATLLRPLLPYSRSELQTYAEQHGLNWIEDPSNEHLTFDRNYLRHEVMPLLKKRWPVTDRSMARSATHLAEANALLLEVAAEDWQRAQDGPHTELSMETLISLSPGRQRNLVRYWIHHINSAPLPDTKRLQQIFSEVMAASGDAEPCVRWQNVALRRYRQRLYLTTAELAVGQTHAWDLRQPLSLGALNIRLSVEPCDVNGLDADLTGRHNIRIGFRQGGEVCRPMGRGGRHHELRKLFQEWGIPPWQRRRVPLLYVGDEIAAVIGFCVCEGYASQRQTRGLNIKIEDLSGDGIARQSENNDNTAD